MSAFTTIVFIYLATGVILSLRVSHRQPLPYTGLRVAAFYIIGLLFFSVAWPLRLINRLAARRQSPPQLPPTPEPFMMQRQFLQTALSLADIEQRETPNDPYQAAPAKAFGFLNPQWQAFVARQPESCQWWSFTAEHPCLPDELEHIEGYAAIVAGEPVDYFIAARWRLCQQLDDSIKTTPKQHAANVTGTVR